jgi:hypothetical protein
MGVLDASNEAAEFKAAMNYRCLIGKRFEFIRLRRTLRKSCVSRFDRLFDLQIHWWVVGVISPDLTGSREAK